MERRIIMCRRHPVLAFDYDPSSGKAVGSGRILDCSRLPLELISHGKPAIYEIGRASCRERVSCDV